MKWKLLPLLCGLLITSGVVKANPGLPVSSEAETLSKDAEFVEMVNSVFNFSADIYLHKKQDALERYAAGTATEADLQDIVTAAGVRDKQQLETFFEKVRSEKSNIAKRFLFLKNDQRDVPILKEALGLMAQRGSLKRFTNVNVDCLASAMGAFAVCYSMADQCGLINQDGNSGGAYNNCISMVTACLALAFIASDQCFNWGILPF